MRAMISSRVEIGGVDDLGDGVSGQNHLFGHQRAGIQHQRTFADQTLALDGDQFGIAGTGADEIDGHSNFPWSRFSSKR
jgi:hypothetical protein